MRDGSLRVLLIEDEPPMVDLSGRMLARQGADASRTQSAESLAAGLERLAHGDIGVVLLDLGLPDSSGLATFAKVRERAPDLPVVVLTGLQDQGAQTPCLRVSRLTRLHAQDSGSDGSLATPRLRQAPTNLRKERSWTRPLPTTTAS